MMNVRKKHQLSITKDSSESITSAVNNNKFYQPRVLLTDHIFGKVTQETLNNIYISPYF